MDDITYKDKSVEQWLPNDYTDFWYYSIGGNTIPDDSVRKVPKVPWADNEKIAKYLQEKNISFELKKNGWMADESNPARVT